MPKRAKKNDKVPAELKQKLEVKIKKVKDGNDISAIQAAS